MTTDSDWEIFKEIKEKAKTRYCERALENVEKTIWNSEATHQERFLDLYVLMIEAEKKMNDIFDVHDPSRIFFQLLLMRREGLVEDDDLEGLSEEILEFSNPEKDMA